MSKHALNTRLPREPLTSNGPPAIRGERRGGCAFKQSSYIIRISFVPFDWGPSLCQLRSRSSLRRGTMKHEQEKTSELIELGSASVDTQGNDGLVPEGGAFWPRTGITDD